MVNDSRSYLLSSTPSLLLRHRPLVGLLQLCDPYLNILHLLAMGIIDSLGGGGMLGGDGIPLFLLNSGVMGVLLVKELR